MTGGPGGRPGIKVLAALGALLALAALYAASSGSREGRWARAEKREMILGIPFEGQLVALENVELGPPAAEVGNEVWQFNLVFLATDGKEIEAGEPVMGFDHSELIKLLETATARRDEAATKLEKKSVEIEIQRRERRLQLAEAESKARKSELGLAVPAELLSRRELDTAKIEDRAARDEIGLRRARLSALERAEEIEMDNLREQTALAAAKVERYQRAIAAMTIRAPKGGTVIVRTRNNTEERFKVGDGVWRAEKVLQIPDLASLRAQVEIDEALGGRLAAGQRATFFLDAHPDRALSGQVELITQSVQRKSWTDPTKVLKVTLSVERGDSPASFALRPGLRLRGQIETDRKAEVLAIPEEAVLIDRDGVYVEARGLLGVRRLRPRLGQRSRGYFEVLGGLEPGQELRLPAPVAEGGA